MARAQVYGERWEIVRSLAEGGQAHTFHVRDLTDGSTGYVLKRLSNVNRQGRFDREIGVLQRLDVRGIPPIIDSGVDDRGRGFLVVPFAGTDLTKLEVSDDLIQAIAIFRQVVEAVTAAHSAGVIHRDIKPNNVVIDDDGVVSLIDFGICSDSTSSDDVLLTTAAEPFGNRSFAAPECEAGSMNQATAASDIYSLGKLLYWLTTPHRLIVREAFDADVIIAVDPFERMCVAEAVSRMVVEEPRSRWTLEEVVEGRDWLEAKILEHRSEYPNLVLTDTFGPSGSYYTSGNRSTTTPPHGDPPAGHYVGQAFDIPATSDFLLERMELAVSRRAGDGRVHVRLTEDEQDQPGADITSWDVVVPAQRPDQSGLVVVRPEQELRLSRGRSYWLYLVLTDASDEDDGVVRRDDGVVA